MPKKNLALVLNAHQVYLPLDDNACTEGIVDFFRTISGTYIPLLNMFESLEKDGISYKISMVFSSSLCTMLADPVMQEKYIEWLDRRIAFGQAEVKRYAGDGEKLKAAKFFLDKAKSDKSDFTEKYEQNLLKYYSLYSSKGYVELIATAATSIFFPYFADLTEAVNAQIETGLYAHKYFFGQSPNGFWLPYLAYSKGLEKNLRSYGIHYTILDSQSILFSETEPEKGLFGPAKFYNSLAVFGRDSENQIKGEDSFIHDSVYCDTQKDAGFEFSTEELKEFVAPGSPRQATDFCYWNNGNSSSAGTEKDGIYDPFAAIEHSKQDALKFLGKKNVRLDKALKILSDSDASLVCTYDASDIGTKWAEGVSWLENVIRSASEFGIDIVCPTDLLESGVKLQKIVPYTSAAFGDGYGENFLDSSNSWMMLYIRKATERMMDLAERFPDDTGLKARLLNLGSRELFIAQSSEWAGMIQEGNNSDYAKSIFKKCIISFTMVFDSLGTNTVSTEWLTKLEKKHAIFPWMNYRIFSKKI